MCIIVVCKEKLPELDTLKTCERNNNHGAGFAWVNKTGEVFWKKGIEKIEREYSFLKKLPLPVVIHFRLASVGNIDRRLTHPFPISAAVSAEITGKTKTGVLFHNGTWVDYKSIALQTLMLKPDSKPLKGLISDTRYLAWFVNHLGVDVCNLLDEKIVILTPKKIEVFGDFVEDEGVLYSNTSYLSNRYVYAYLANIVDRNRYSENRNRYSEKCKFKSNPASCVYRNYRECNSIWTQCPYK